MELRGFGVEIRSGTDGFLVLNRGVVVCGTEGFLGLRGFWCGTEGF